MRASPRERNPRAQRKRNGREAGGNPRRIAGRSPAGGVESERS